jgi:hypothetical protein
MSNPSRASGGSPRALGAGLTLAVSVGGFAYGGLWLDARAGTTPLFVLLGVGCGAVGGMLHLIRVLAPEMWPFGKPPRQLPRSGPSEPPNGDC